MFQAINADSKEAINITPSQILSLQPNPTNDTTVVVFINARGTLIKGSHFINKSTDAILSEIKALNGDLEKLGDFYFGAYTTNTRPKIKLNREEDSSTHKTFCMACGFTKQVYHSQTCDCKIQRPYNGTLKDNSLTKQLIVLSKDDAEKLLIADQLKFNKIGDNIAPRTVYDIELNNGDVFGYTDIKGHKIKVYAEDEFETGLAPKQTLWFS